MILDNLIAISATLLLFVTYAYLALSIIELKPIKKESLANNKQYVPKKKKEPFKKVKRSDDLPSGDALDFLKENPNFYWCSKEKILKFRQVA